MSRRLVVPVLAASALALGGCISLFPKTPPAQLYSFATGPGGEAPPAQAPAASGEGRIGLIFPPVNLPRAAAGDQLLTRTGPEAAYIAAVRWVSPAAVLWGEAVDRAFAGRSSRTRLLSRQEIAGAQGFLRLDVTDFEARYPAPEAAPTVRVTVTATLAHRSGVYAADHTFTAEAPAAENGARAIVDAYGQAVQQVAGELVAWTDANAARAAEEGPPTTGAALPGRLGGSLMPGSARRESRTTTNSVTVTPPRP